MVAALCLMGAHLCVLFILFMQHAIVQAQMRRLEQRVSELEVRHEIDEWDKWSDEDEPAE